MANKFYFDGIETSCTRIARNMCGPDEYAVTINDNGTEYEVLLLAGPFGTDEQICADGYAQWRKEHPTNPDSTPSTMNADETANALELLEALPATAVRVAAAALLPAKYFDEYFTPETANVEYLRSMLEDAITEHDITAAQLNEAASRRPRIFKPSHAAKDIEQVTRNYAAYIVDCAKYEIENA